MILYGLTVNGVAPTVPDDGSAVREVRNLILERVGETGLVDDAQIRSFVRRANRKVWRRAIRANSRPWQSRTEVFTYPASGSFAVELLGGLAPEDAAEFAIQLGGAQVAKICYLEVSYLNGWQPIQEGLPEDRWQYEPGNPVVQTAPRIPSAYYLEGDQLWFTPLPAAALPFRATVVGMMPAPSDAEHLLWGRFPDHHDLVVTEGARLCFSRDDKKETPFDAEAQELWADFMLALRAGQGNRVRHVGPRGPYSP